MSPSDNLQTVGNRISFKQHVAHQNQHIQNLTSLVLVAHTVLLELSYIRKNNRFLYPTIIKTVHFSVKENRRATGEAAEMGLV